MSTLLSQTKIRLEHLDRQAFIYVRQSTIIQVRENTASTARQYDLVQRARDLGGAPEHIVVIDQDQGHSGASTTGRDGFQALLVAVGLGHAGAVLSLEVSRLARSCSDWYRLIEICAVTETLVIDEEGVYDPGQYNDRLLLGFKGTMSEAELHWLRSRLLGGKLEKAEHGQLRMRLPVGLIYDPAHHVVLDPDEEVQHAVRLVFDLFEKTGTALAIVKHFQDQHLHFPNRFWGGLHDGELIWEALRLSRVLSLLHNPAYAGVYVYGRTQTRTRTLPGEAPRLKGRTRQIKRENWPIVLPEAHPGYITWEQFVRNQARLDDNRTYRHEDHRGAPREGAALLQGIVLCGQCGRRMSVRYFAETGTHSYECTQVHTHLAGPTCQCLRGDLVDIAVTCTFLEALQPAQLEISLATLAEIEAQARQLDRQLELRLERSHYEADLARRRFLAVEPENRLVARSLEHEWNEKLAEGERLEKESTARPSLVAHLLTPPDRERILALAQDVPAVWNATTTTQVERKQLVRFLIKDVTLTKRATTIHITIRWQTEACTPLDIPRPRRSYDVRRTSPAVVARVRQLAINHTDQQIADQLNAEGLTPGLGGQFTPSKVQWLRYAYAIPTLCPDGPGLTPNGQRGDGRYCVQAAAKLLNVNISTIVDWCKAGKLDGLQTVPHGPWWVNLPPERIAELRKPVQQRWRKSAQSKTNRRILDSATETTPPLTTETL
jgi:DNA invertase Pin-like site-specific DNA recombinase